jgi:hypothetical protein
MRSVVTGGSEPHTHRNGVDSGDCRCPWCRQTVSRDELIEIQVRQSELIFDIEERVKDRLIAERDVEIEKVRQEAAAAVEAAEQAVMKREAAIRREAAAAAATVLAPKLAAAEEARKTAEQAVKAAKATFDAALKERLEVQAEAAAKARVEAVNGVTEKFFGENLRLQERVLELQRMLEKKTANELGHSGEIDAYEAILREFGEIDQVSRIPTGVNGPDIMVRVFTRKNGSFAGTIAVEVKNHKRWSNAWVPKLKGDMLEHGASHGVIITSAFSAGESQLSVRDSIVIASPPRAMAVIGILRRAVIACHMLKLTQEERDEKMAAVYRLMTSDRASERWERMSAATDDLMEIETTDAAHQEKVRKKRLGLIHAVQDVHSEFTGDLDALIRGEPEDIL